MRRYLEGFACLALASLVGAVGARADGPRNSVERNVSAMCAKADFDGDSYRPFVCPPRCTCDFAPVLTAYPDGGSCLEGPVGEFAVDLLADPPPPGCGPLGPPADLIDVCSTSSQDACQCSCPADLSTFPFTCVGPLTCNGCTQAGGETCITYGSPEPGPNDTLVDDGLCFLACGDASECPPGAPDVATLAIGGIGDGSDETVAATCTLPSASPVPMNPNDALDCVAQLETAIGQACSPAP